MRVVMKVSLIHGIINVHWACYDTRSVTEVQERTGGVLLQIFTNHINRYAPIEVDFIYPVR